MASVKKLLRATANLDTPIDDLDVAFSFYTLEGHCKKCNIGDFTLIVTDFKHNKIDQKESIFRTVCMCCGSKDIYLAKQVSLI